MLTNEDYDRVLNTKKLSSQYVSMENMLLQGKYSP